MFRRAKQLQDLNNEIKSKIENTVSNDITRVSELKYSQTKELIRLNKLVHFQLNVREDSKLTDPLTTFVSDQNCLFLDR